jgi:hypothetical protein
LAVTAVATSKELSALLFNFWLSRAMFAVVAVNALSTFNADSDLTDYLQLYDDLAK